MEHGLSLSAKRLECGGLPALLDGPVRAKRLGLRQSPAAFATVAQAKAPENWRTPRRFAPNAALPIFMACGAARGVASERRANIVTNSADCLISG